MIERSASGDDVKSCPNCQSRDSLVIRWIQGIDRRVHKYTEVGCVRCNVFFRGREDRYPITEWNMFVIAENEKKGIVDPHAELYRLLHAYHQEEQKEHLARENIDKYLEKKIAPLCPFAHSDRFKFHGRHDGIWSAQSVKAVYGTNTGPFWILTARNVLPSGRLGHIQREFWQRDAKLMLPLKPYWKPHTWREVVERDSCLYKGNLGEIVAVNHSTKKAHITSNNETIVVRQLRDLKVPLSRMEENVI